MLSSRLQDGEVGLEAGRNLFAPDDVLMAGGENEHTDHTDNSPSHQDHTDNTPTHTDHSDVS